MNTAEMLEHLENEGIIKKYGKLWGPGPNYGKLEPVPMKLSDGPIEITSKPFSEGLTEKRDMEIKQSLLAMQVKFLKHGKNWIVQRLGNPKGLEHILISTQPVKNAQFTYYPPEKKAEAKEATPICSYSMT